MQIIVLGMHRSGTSMVAGLSHLMGLNVGAQDKLMPESFDNPKGFWERLDFYKANNQLLNSVNCKWNKVYDYDLDDVSESDLNLFRTQVALIIDELNCQESWIIKDPRACLTFPLWKDLLARPICIHVYRNPIDVALSLNKRNGMPIEAGLGLWEVYNKAAFLATQGMPRFIISYDKILNDPINSIKMYQQSLEGLGVERLPELSESDILNFVSPNLQHHKTSNNLYKEIQSNQLKQLVEAIASEEILDSGISNNEFTKPESLKHYEVNVLHKQLETEQVLRKELQVLRKESQVLSKESQVLSKESQVLRKELVERSNKISLLDRANLECKASLKLAQIELEEIKKKADAFVDVRNLAYQALGLLKIVEQSSSWKMGRKIIVFLKLISGKKAKQDFSVVAKEIETKLRRHGGHKSKEDPQASDLTKKAKDILNKIIVKGGVVRRYEVFNFDLNKKTKDELNSYLGINGHISDILVSIVMPTYNRAKELPISIGSVINQSHYNWELFVVDDGSVDETCEVMEGFLSDSRIKYIRKKKIGVGAARNVALDNAQGDIISFLDSDNEWHEDYLSLVVAGLHKNSVDVVYSGLEIYDGAVKVGYRGDEFNYAECLKGNYVDLNTFSHLREKFSNKRFDIDIRRFNDWDYILNLTFESKVKYLPFLGVKYNLNSLPNQISTTEPYLYRKIVTERYEAKAAGKLSNDVASVAEEFRCLNLTYAIRISAPRNKKDSWGDYHFAVGLGEAIQDQGNHYDIYYYNESIEKNYDVVIVLRGLTGYKPIKNSLNIIWSISHPELVDFSEFEEFDMVFVASDSFCNMLEMVSNAKPIYLPQATDVNRFHFNGKSEYINKLLFVGNSRGIRRNSVDYALNSMLPLKIFGGGWKGIIPNNLVSGKYVENTELSELYSSYRAVLNDHWGSMKDFGYVSNRVYDVMASGGVVISDWFPELEKIFGNVVLTYKNEQEFNALSTRILNCEPHHEERKENSMKISELHSFNKRFEKIFEKMLSYITYNSSCYLTDKKKGTDEVSIVFFPQFTGVNKLSSSAYIRILQPLSSDLINAKVKINIFRSVGELLPEKYCKFDAVIVSRTAIGDIVEAKKLVESVARNKIPLFIDIDDGFHLMDEDHSEYKLYKDKIEVLKFLLLNSSEIWSSTNKLQQSLSKFFDPKKIYTIENTLDPRLWRRYRDREKPVDRKCVEFLYMGTKTHQKDFDYLLPLFDDLFARHGAKFALTVIGVGSDLPKRPWLKVRSPSIINSKYPYFSRWMRKQAKDFDVGIAPLVNSPFNDLKSDVKALEYTALGLKVLSSNVGAYTSSDYVTNCDTLSDWNIALDEVMNKINDDNQNLEALLWQQRSSSIAGESMVDRIKKVALEEHNR